MWRSAPRLLAALGDEGAGRAADERAGNLSEERAAEARAAERGNVEEDSPDAERADPDARDTTVSKNAATAAATEGLHHEWLEVIEGRGAGASCRVDGEGAHARVTHGALPGRAVAGEALRRVALAGAKAGVGHGALEQAVVVDAHRAKASAELLHGARRRAVGRGRTLDACVTGAGITKTGISGACSSVTTGISALIDGLKALARRESGQREDEQAAHGVSFDRRPNESVR